MLSWASAGKERKRFGPGVRKRVGPRGWIGPEREEGAGPQGKGKGFAGWAGVGFGLLWVWV